MGLKKKHIKWKLLILTFISVLYNVSAQIQATSDEVKAVLIIQICDNVNWNHSLPDEFTIGYFCNEESLYNQLKITENKVKIHGKEVRVQKINTIEEINTCNAVYYNYEDYKNYTSVSRFIRESDYHILLITDNYSDPLFIYINLYEENNKIGFKINMPNLTFIGFSINQNILLNGGSIVDIKKAFEKFEEQVTENKNKIKESEAQLRDMEKLLVDKDKIIKVKEQEIEKYIKNSSIYKRQSDSLDNLVKKQKENLILQTRELTKKDNALQNIYTDINNKQTELIALKENIRTYQQTSDTLKNLIGEQKYRLNEQDERIKTQHRFLLASLGLGLTLLILGFTFYSLFKLKRKHNVILEKKVEERTSELRKSEQNYREIFNGVSDYIFIQDTQGKILAVNQPMLHAFGYDKKDIENLNIGMLSDEKQGYTNEKVFEMYKLTKEKGQHTFDWLAKRKNGEAFWVIVTLSHTTIGGSNRILAVVHDNDINKRNELELEKHRNHLEMLVKEQTQDLEAANEEMKSTNEELFEKNEIINNQNNELKATLQHLQETQAQLLQAEKMASLGILTAGVAHEINNPLNYIMGAYNGLQYHFENKSFSDNYEQIGVLINALKVGVDRSSKIVQGLNQFSRDSKSLDEDCDIHAILDNCLSILQNQIKHKIKVVKHFSSVDLSIKGNVGNLHQAFINIIVNAIHSISTEGIISIETKFIEQTIIIEITDNGEGISPENLEKVTDPFFTTKDPGKGTGLGLAITYNIIKEHKGKLEFKSELGNGTTVKITLPQNR